MGIRDRLHTARSRNDQVALDVRLTLRKDCAGIKQQLRDLVKVLCQKAEQYSACLLYTSVRVKFQAGPLGFWGGGIQPFQVYSAK